jgi:hypothetical protein
MGLGAALLLAPAAHAKGPGLDHAVLDGPGIDHPIYLENRYPYLLSVAMSMHLFGSRRDSDVAVARPKSDDLGPRYLLTYHPFVGKPVVVDLYLYADGAPVAFAPRGQSVSVGIGRTGSKYRFEVKPGWYEYRPRLIADLREHGLPPPTAPRRGADGISAWPLLLLAPAMFGVLLLIRRSSRVAIPEAQ